MVTTSSAAAFNLPLNGSGMDFQLVIVGSPTATIVTGQTAEFSLSVEPVGASSGNVEITCEGEPKNSTCLVSPAAAQMTAGNSIFVSVKLLRGRRRRRPKQQIAPEGRSGPSAVSSHWQFCCPSVSVSGVPVDWQFCFCPLSWRCPLLAVE